MITNEFNEKSYKIKVAGISRTIRVSYDRSAVMLSDVLTRRWKASSRDFDDIIGGIVALCEDGKIDSSAVIFSDDGEIYLSLAVARGMLRKRAGA
jgi:hypothetical protein